ncbi:MAG: zinc ribbon domain-containing protein [Bacteroidales bacterium]|nr:zinc ribbon domain-containing protein [Bacteroidales bacterium]
MEKENKMCQSCGMPMKKDPEKGGSEADGAKSKMYCSFCYKDGKFTTDCTAKEMQEFCKNMLVEKMKMPKFIAKILTYNVPKLKRWNP